jgi:alpha-tubulin suppressor-like RCC1 family protein
MKRALDVAKPLTLNRLRLRHYLDAFDFNPKILLSSLILSHHVPMDVTRLIQYMVVIMTFEEYNIDVTQTQMLSPSCIFTLRIDDKCHAYLNCVPLQWFEIDQLRGIVVDTACGLAHSLLLTTRGLLGFGNNTHYQLGSVIEKSGTVDPKYPRFIDIKTDAKDIISVHCGCDYSAVLTTTALYVFGSNLNDQLNTLGEFQIEPTPFKFPYNEKILSVACSDRFMLILTQSGLYKSGGGDVRFPHNKYFTKLNKPYNGKIVKIACGSYHAMVLNNTGELYGFGENRNGQMGLLHDDGGDGDSTSLFNLHKVTIPILSSPIQSIHCGSMHTMVLATDGTLYACGYNAYGQLGLGDKDHRYEFVHVPLEKKVSWVYLSNVSHKSTIVTIDDKILVTGQNNGMYFQ